MILLTGGAGYTGLHTARRRRAGLPGQSLAGAADPGLVGPAQSRRNVPRRVELATQQSAGLP